MILTDGNSLISRENFSDKESHRNQWPAYSAWFLISPPFSYWSVFKCRQRRVWIRVFPPLRIYYQKTGSKGTEENP